MRHTLVILGGCCAAFTCAITAIAAVRDLCTTGTTHGAAWTLLSAVAAVVSAGGFAAVLALGHYYDRQHYRQHDIKAGFARPFPTPETRDLDV